MNFYLIIILLILIGFIWLQREQEIRTFMTKAPAVIPEWFEPELDFGKPVLPKMPEFGNYEDSYYKDLDGYCLLKADDKRKDLEVPKELADKALQYNAARENYFRAIEIYNMKRKEEAFFQWRIYYAKELRARR